MPTDDEHPRPTTPASAGEMMGWRGRVEETVRHVAAERGIDFTPIPEAVAAAVPGLADSVGELAAAMDERERQWLAVVLAALAEQVQRASLPEAHRDAPPGTRR
jgi:hypothetical protein